MKPENKKFTRQEESRVMTKIDLTYKPSFVGRCSRITLLVLQLGLLENEIHLVKGWFQVTVPLHREKVGKIAVLRLDGDWYESTKIPLDNFVKDRSFWADLKMTAS